LLTNCSLLYSPSSCHHLIHIRVRLNMQDWLHHIEVLKFKEWEIASHQCTTV
jgi:hypothetical protein